MNIIIWGLKPYTHTHSWIHFGFYKAFRYMGFPVYWLDSNDSFDPNLFNNALVISEAHNDQYIPLNQNAIYFVHRYKPHTYLGMRVVNFDFYSKPVEAHQVRTYAPHYENMSRVLKSYEKISDLVYFSNEPDANNYMFAPTLFMAWGTDLLPDDIELIHTEVIKANRREDVYFIGSVWGANYIQMQKFSEALQKKNIPFQIMGIHHGQYVNNELAKHLTRLSLFSPAIVGDVHLDIGYIPCRFFKNISYSRMAVTNSEHIKEIFPDIIYEPSHDLLVEKALEFESNPQPELLAGLMNEIRTKHTFVNRAQAMLSILQ